SGSSSIRHRGRPGSWRRPGVPDDTAWLPATRGQVSKPDVDARPRRSGRDDAVDGVEVERAHVDLAVQVGPDRDGVARLRRKGALGGDAAAGDAHRAQDAVTQVGVDEGAGEGGHEGAAIDTAGR